MSKGLEAFERLKEGDSPSAPRDIGIIEKELKAYEMEHTLRIRLENVNYELVREKQENEKKLKAFDTLSKDYEKVMKELSKEIEKNRAFEIIKALAIFIIYQDIGGLYNLETIVDSVSLTKEEYDLLKEVLNYGDKN